LKSAEYQGYWWLPEKPDLQVFGTLRLGPEATLELFGAFSQPTGQFRPAVTDIILGVSFRGKRITLHRCLQFGLGYSCGGTERSSFSIMAVYVGVHFERMEDIKFKDISVVFDHIDDWVEISGIRVKHRRPFSAIIRYKTPPDYHAVVNHCRISLLFLPALDHSRIPPEAKFTQQIAFLISMREQSSLQAYLEVIYQIQNFLAFAVTVPIHPLIVDGTTEANKTVHPSGKTVYPPVQIVLPFVKGGKTQSDSDSSPINAEDMLFRFSDVRRRFQRIMRNWFKASETLRPIYDLYFGTLYNPQMYVQHRFLSLIQAVESYHQRRAPRQHELPPKKFASIREAIHNRCPPRYRNWLDRKLQNANELSLNQRVQFLLAKHAFLRIQDRNGFVDKVVDTRNYLTHYSKRLEKRAASPDELIHLCRQLRALLEAVLLEEIGFDSAKIQDIMSRIEGRRSIFTRLTL
jgi:hypothetical protein